MNIRTICFTISLVLSCIFIPGTTNAQGQHPYCLRAITDLRTARAALQQHINGKSMTHNEKEALRQINEIIREISEAATEDGKAPNDHLQLREGQDDASLIHQCIEFLRKAKDDLNREEDGQFANGLRDRSIRNCDDVIRFVERTRNN